MIDKTWTAERIWELQRLCEAATHGPWEATCPRVNWRVRSATGVYIIEAGYGVNNQKPDATFIAAARTALPEALAEIERLNRQAASDAEALAAAREDVARLTAELNRHVGESIDDFNSAEDQLAAKDAEIAKLQGATNTHAASSLNYSLALAAERQKRQAFRKGMEDYTHQSGDRQGCKVMAETLIREFDAIFGTEQA